jgi:hypothetical protein
MKLRRGFKKEAHDYAREFRNELKLPLNAPLCPRRLAEHLEIPIIALSSLRPLAPKPIDYLLGPGRNQFFAVTISIGYRRFILHNDGNPPTRQVSNLAHELSHAILGHPPSPPFNENGERTLDQEIEKEAVWLGGTLLISEEAALTIARSKVSETDAANHFGVSPALIRMRLNFTAAHKRVA